MSGVIKVESDLGDWLVVGSSSGEKKGTNLQVNDGQGVEMIDLAELIAHFAQDFTGEGSILQKELYEQIRRDMTGTTILIDGEQFSGVEGKDAQEIFQRLKVSKQFQSDEEVLRFMSLLQQGIFASGWNEIVKGVQEMTDRELDLTFFSSQHDSIDQYCSQNRQKNYEIVLHTGPVSLKGIMHYVLFSKIMPKKEPQAIIKSCILIDPSQNYAQRTWQVVKVFP